MSPVAPNVTDALAHAEVERLRSEARQASERYHDALLGAHDVRNGRCRRCGARYEAILDSLALECHE